MIEKCYVMIKPGFVSLEVIQRTCCALVNTGVRMIDSAYFKYDDETARLHYIEKQAKPYCQELIDYLTSDQVFGMIFEGDDALRKCRETVEELRTTLKDELDLKTDVMRNILHCSSKTKVGSTMLELDTQREIALFNYLKSTQGKDYKAIRKAIVKY